MTQTQEENGPAASALECADEATEAGQAAGGSTLLEFPGTRSTPPWRKELSERVREIQQKRAREAALEAEAAARRSEIVPEETVPPHTQEGSNSSHLGLVPSPPDAPELNPLVAAALRRIERARQPATKATPAPRTAGGANQTATAAAVARVAEERYETKAKPRVNTRPEVSAPQASHAEASIAPEPKNEAPRASALVALPTQGTARATAKPGVTQTAMSAPKAVAPLDAPPKVEITAKAEVPAKAPAVEPKPVSPKREAQKPRQSAARGTQADKPQPRHVSGTVIDDAWLSRLEEKILPPVNAATRKPEDIAPVVPRLAAGLMDLLVVAFLSSPFAAIIELTNGNWSDPRVAASMGGIVLTVMFLYLTISIALAGRTWAMSVFNLHTVDAETAHVPTLGQCVRRTLVYIISLASFGLGILYALFDAERRAAHDHFSGTVVVRE